MTRTKNYHHFCPIARSLEVIGEKWSLLVVRDLLRGPARFSDLMRYLGGITPKWLTARLRELEAAGIITRDSQPGRREVWYKLTEKGKGLGPVIEGLLVWGVDNALRPPLPGEAVFPEQTVYATATYHNSKGTQLPQPVEWQIDLDDGKSHAVSFDGKRWRPRRLSDGPPDVAVTADRDSWMRFVTTPRAERELHGLAIQGHPERVEEFLRTFGVLQASMAAVS
ncbi:MAG: helix-turn-helix domain-containing protein [Dehalococcoidia bacterium]